jgi:uncharacterized protein DUF5666
MSTEIQSRKEEKMSKVSRVFGAAMLCLGLLTAGIVMAQQDPAAPANPQKKEHKMKTAMLNGTVSAVTDSALTIVDSQKAEHTVAVTSETKVTKAGKDATLADVKANDVVTVEVQKGEGNTLTALKISVA